MSREPWDRAVGRVFRKIRKPNWYPHVFGPLRTHQTASYLKQWQFTAFSLALCWKIFFTAYLEGHQVVAIQEVAECEPRIDTVLLLQNSVELQKHLSVLRSWRIRSVVWWRNGVAHIWISLSFDFDPRALYGWLHEFEWIQTVGTHEAVASNEENQSCHGASIPENCVVETQVFRRQLSWTKNRRSHEGVSYKKQKMTKNHVHHNNARINLLASVSLSLDTKALYNGASSPRARALIQIFSILICMFFAGVSVMTTNWLAAFFRLNFMAIPGINRFRVWASGYGILAEV